MIDIEFENTGSTFSALYAAQKWLKENGYSYGSTDITGTVAIQKGEYTLPQKIKNFTKEEVSQADGFMLSSDFREGKVIIQLK